jgi:hypothetical protein
MSGVDMRIIGVVSAAVLDTTCKLRAVNMRILGVDATVAALDAFCTQRAVDAAKAAEAAEAAAAASRKESVEMALASMHQESSFGGYMDKYNLRP